MTAAKLAELCLKKVKKAKDAELKSIEQQENPEFERVKQNFRQLTKDFEAKCSEYTELESAFGEVKQRFKSLLDGFQAYVAESEKDSQTHESSVFLQIQELKAQKQQL